MIAAAIDIGTNSVLLTVGERAPGGEIHILDDRSEITRLGQGVDHDRLLRPEAMARTAAAVAEFAERARRLGAAVVRAVGTSAARDARNTEAFARLLRERAGLALEVLSGEEEARLSYQAVRGDASLGLPPGDLIVVDIGGGSAEFIHGDEAAIRFRASIDCGAVRTTERFFADDPPTPAQMAAAAAWLDARLGALPDLPAGAPLVGIGGTFVNLAGVRLALPEFQPGRLHGLLLDRGAVERQIARFASMPTEARRGIPGLEPKRADIILAGALLLGRILERRRADVIRVSVRGLRYGVLFEMMAGEAPA
ncbi:MAG: Ppx/GppA family phosphatase [Armatimonadetes bacterium]|nr:Ppx/GppA family phosphatase [Armatimonadota bacterium]